MESPHQEKRFNFGILRSVSFRLKPISVTFANADICSLAVFVVEFKHALAQVVFISEP